MMLSGFFLPRDGSQSRRDSFQYWAAGWPAVSESLASAGIAYCMEGWPGGEPHYAALGVTPETVREALKEAIEKAGTQGALAAAIGEDVKTGHIFYWLKVGAIPEKHCAVIEQRTGVSRRRLCQGWARVWPELLDADQQQGA